MKFLVRVELGEVRLIEFAEMIKFVLLHFYIQTGILSLDRELLEVKGLYSRFIFSCRCSDSLISLLLRWIHILGWN